MSEVTRQLQPTLAKRAPSVPGAQRNLSSYLEMIWEQNFADTPRANEVQIGYCYPWKTRLGLIRLSLDQKTSFIGINALLQLQQVPEYVLITTIAHELTHYAHGFGSPLPRIWKHPHANRVVDSELERRHLGEQLRKCNQWIDEHWYPFYDAQGSLICRLRSSQARSRFRAEVQRASNSPAAASDMAEREAGGTKRNSAV